MKRCACGKWVLAAALAAGATAGQAATPAVGVLGQESDGTIKLRLQGGTNSVHAIQAGSNLVDWATILAVRPESTNGITFTDPESAKQPRRYYRVVEHKGLRDTTAPGWNGDLGLRFSRSGTNGLNLAWAGARDAIGVAAYRIYINGRPATTLLGNVHSLTLTGLDFTERQDIRIEAVDASGNVSGREALIYVPGDALLAATDDSGNLYVSAWQTNAFANLQVVANLGVMARGVTMGDFDRDGIQDLVSCYHTNWRLYPRFFRGRADGTYEPARELPSCAGGTWVAGMAADDYDADGFLDFIVGSGDSGWLGFYWGNGDGTFTVTEGQYAANGRAMDSGDVNEDGLPDFVRAEYGAGYLRCYLSRGDRTFAQTNLVGDVGDDPYGVALGDFDEDGHLDVLANSGGSGDAYLYKGYGNGLFSNGVNVASVDANDYAAWDAWDYNGDGHLDIVMTTYNNQNVYYYPGLGDGAFAARTVLPNRPGNRSLGIAAPLLAPRVDVRISPELPAVPLNRFLALAAAGGGVRPTDAFAWRFDDGSVLHGQIVSNRWATEGRRVVRLTHTNATGVASVRGTWITVTGLPPSANAGGPYTFGEDKASQLRWTAELDGGASTDDFPLVAFIWNFGDGTVATNGTNTVVTHTWTNTGPWAVTLTVVDRARQLGTNLTTVTFVPGAPPVAAISAPSQVDEAVASQGRWTVPLSAAASTDDNGIWKYEWRFGDGKTGSGRDVTAAFAATNHYTVELTVTDHAGQTNRTTHALAVADNDSPVARIRAAAVVDETAARNGVWNANFSAEDSTDDFGLWKYDWAFGDGKTGAGRTVGTTYGAANAYTVTLTVTDHAGQRHSSTFNVRIKANYYPMPMIWGPTRLDEAVATNGLWFGAWDGSISSDDTGISRHDWRFGDGDTASGSRVTHQYRRAGVYPLSLTVTDHGNQAMTVTQRVTVAANEPPVARLTASPLTPEGAQPVDFSAAASTDDFGIMRYRWLLPPRVFAFDGNAVDHLQWVATDGVTQGDRLAVAGVSTWDTRYVLARDTLLRRGSVFECRVDTAAGSGTHAMVGFKNLNAASGHYNQFPCALYFNNGTLEVYEYGSGRGSFGGYTRGTSYDVRIETKPDAGARYYLRASGTGDAFQLVYDSPNQADTAFSFGMVVYAGTFGLDDVRVTEVYRDARALRAPVWPAGTVTLEVVDHAMQTARTSVAINSFTGAPPAAVISGPAGGATGAELAFDGSGSSDDHGVASYMWSFGDGTPAAYTALAPHFFGAAGVYEVTLAVRDFAGQASVATQRVTIVGEPLVVAVPWRIVGDVELPHETWTNRTITLKAVAENVATPFDWRWDFGDGSPAVTGTAATVAQAFGLEARHAYTGSEGTPFTATITITTTNGLSSSDRYSVLIRPKTLKAEMNVAIDEGLWFMHKSQVRNFANPARPEGYWEFRGYGYFLENVTASAVQGYAINGHQEGGDAARDPYVNTVRRAVTFLLNRLRSVSIATQTYGDPDSNRNGIGLVASDDRGPYNVGPIIDALVANGDPERIAQTGAANVRGRYYRDLVADMVDAYAWAQSDQTWGGGWQYGWNDQAADNSVSQWGAIGMLAAEHYWRLEAPRWAKERNLVWLENTRGASGWAYQSRGDSLVLTPSALIQATWAGLTTGSGYWRQGEDYIARNWATIMSWYDMYAEFGIAKAMRLAQPQPVTRFAATGKDWFLDPVDGMARLTIDRQGGDGSWLASSRSYLGDRMMSSAWSILILSSSLFQQGPVAVVHVRPNPCKIAWPVRFDASGSYHQHPSFRITEYRWDFDQADGVNFDTPDAVGPIVQHPFGSNRTYTVSLQVRDNNTPPAYDVALLTVAINDLPHPPVADAGGPYVAAVGEALHLDGTGSFDIDVSDGDAIRAYDWDVDFVQPLDFADGVTGSQPHVLQGFAAAGVHNVGLRVTDSTASVYPNQQSDLSSDAFATVTVYDELVTDLRARPKRSKIQLTWTQVGVRVDVHRSTVSASTGFVKIGETTSPYATYLDSTVAEGADYFYRIYVFDLTHPDPIGVSRAVYAKAPRAGDAAGAAPFFTSTPPTGATLGRTYAYQARAVDPGGSALVYELLAGPTGMVVNAAGGFVTLTPTVAQLGQHDVWLQARNPAGQTALQAYKLTIDATVNQPPVAALQGPRTGVQGAALAFASLGTQDPDGDALGYLWSFGDGATAATPNPVHVYPAAGLYSVQLFVNDGHGGTASASLLVGITPPNRAPVALVDGGPAFAVRMRHPLALNGRPSYDYDGDPLTFAWSWGDGAPDGAGLAASHAYGALGTFTGRLAVTDGRGGRGEYAFTVAVSASNRFPVAALDVPQPGTNVMDRFTFDASASTDPDNDPLLYYWNFGDNSAIMGPVAAHFYAQPGDYTVRVAVVDNHAATGMALRVVHVNAPPVFQSTPSLTNRQGAAYTYRPVVTDADGDPLAFSLATGPATMGLESPTNGVLNWTTSNDDVGANRVALVVTDGHGSVVTQAFVVTVADVNDPPEISSTPGTNATEEVLYTYQLHARDVDDTNLQFSLVTRPPNMVLNPISGLLWWTPENVHTGANPVVVTVSDPRGGVATQRFTIVVADVNDPPVITTTPVVAATEDTPYTHDVDAADPDDAAGTLRFALNLAPPGMVIDHVTGVIAWTPLAASPGEPVQVVAFDPRGGVATQGFTVVVANVNDAPVIGSRPVYQALVNVGYRYDVNATDEDGDALAYELGAGPAGLAIDPASGLVTWTPAAGQEGTATVTVVARDAPGATGSQTYTLVVQAANRAPFFTSVAPATASEDRLYTYDANATDPDGNPLTYQLAGLLPADLTCDPATGLVQWTPSAAYNGDVVTVQVWAADAFIGTSQTFTVTVAPVNDAPVFTSAPVTNAEVGMVYGYTAEAVDEEGDAIAYSLPTAPAGLALTAAGAGATNVLTWRPAAGQVGARAVVVRARDAGGAVTDQSFTVRVVDGRHPPVVAGIGDQVVQDPNAFLQVALDDFVADPDHADAELAWTVQGRSRLTVAITNRIATIGYAPGTRVTETLTFTARDPDNLTGFATATFTVAEPSQDSVPPVLFLDIPEGGERNTPLALDVLAEDNEGVANVTVKVDGVARPVQNLGGGRYRVIYTTPAVGLHTVLATVIDRAGNAFSDTRTTLIVDPAVTAAGLQAAITAPVEDALLGDVTEVQGTALGPNFVDYVLEYAENGTADYVEFARGAAPVADGPLGTLDPSTLPAGVYTLRLTVRNTGGAKRSASIVVELTGNEIIGPFALRFKDKTLHVGGFPIGIVRTYDNRARGVPGDFGYGWDLAFSDVKLVSRYVPGDHWVMDTERGFFPVYTLRATKQQTLTVYFGDRDKHTFRMQPSPRSSILYPISFLEGMEYDAVSGAKGSIAPDSGASYFDGGVILDAGFEIFDPQVYHYTAANGYRYTFRKPPSGTLRYELERITDPDGNSLTMSDAGIVRSDGTTLRFVRDAANRVMRIEDPLGATIHYEYSVRGDLAAVVDELGNRTTFIYNRDHNLREIRDPLNRPLQKQEFDTNGRLVALTDANGSRLTLEHDLDANTEILRDRRGNAKIFQYNDAGYVLKQTEFPTVHGVVMPVTTTNEYAAENRLAADNLGGRRRAYTYDATGKLLSEIVDVGGLNLATRYTYSAAGKLESVLDANGHVATNLYNASRQRTQRVDRAGAVTTYTYGAQGRRVRETDALGNYTEYDYDGRSNKIRSERFSADGVSLRKQTYTYDANGNKLTETLHLTVDGVAQPVTTSYRHDAKGRVVAVTDALGHTASNVYDSLGQVIETVDKLGGRTRYTYDMMRQLVRTDHPDGTFETRAYDPDGNATSRTDRAGVTRVYAYDAVKRITQVTSPGGAARRFEYDVFGNRTAEIDEFGQRTDYVFDKAGRQLAVLLPSVVDARSGAAGRPVIGHAYDPNGNLTALVDANSNRTAYVFDAENRLLATRLADGHVLTNRYDALGRLVAKSDAAGNTVTYAFDALDRVVSVTQPAVAGQPAAVTRYAYDEAGNLLTATDARGRVTQFAYDLAGRRTARTLPGGQRETFAYDAMGQVVAHTDFNGRLTRYSFDAGGRLTGKDLPAGPDVQLSYDAGGRLQRVVDGLGTTSYGYDALGRTAAVTNPTGSTVTYSYDAAGNILTVASAGGATAYTYDALKRVTAVRDSRGLTTTMGYDPAGNLVRQALPNGVGMVRSFNTRDQLVGVVNRRSDNTLLSSFAYTLDANGLRTGVMEADGSAVTYVYDARYRLTSETRTGAGAYVTTYAYDLVGNRTAASLGGTAVAYTYDANDRLTGTGTETYYYDASGNMTGRTDAAGFTALGYDEENRLTRVTAPGGAVTTYAYDLYGNRVRRTDGGGTREFVVDPRNLSGQAQVVDELDGAGGVVTHYTRGASLLAEDEGATRLYYVADGQGSTRQLVNGAQAVTDTFRYDGYGRLLDRTGAHDTPFQFTGEAYDPAVGAYYLRARYYDPRTGRFLGMDPDLGGLKDPTSLHRYLYAHNNPVNLLDPSGRFSLCEVSISINIQASLQSAYVKSVITTGLDLVEIIFCMLEPAWDMVWMGLDMIVNDVPGGEAMFSEGKRLEAGAFQAMQQRIADHFQELADELNPVKIEIESDLLDYYEQAKEAWESLQNGDLPMPPLPEKIQNILDFKDKVTEYLGAFTDALDDEKSNCERFKGISTLAKGALEYLPEF